MNLNFKKLSTSVKVAEFIYLLSLVVYLICFLDGGMFTTYFAAMGVLLIGAVSSVYLAIKKQWLFTAGNLLCSVLVFLHFVNQ